MYISLLRGINVGGQKKVKMEDLRNLYTNLGFAKVQTYIQSGNVVFESEENDLSKIQEKIEKGILEKFGYEVKVFILDKVSFEQVIANNPYEDFVYFTFLSQKPSNIPHEAFEKMLRPSEKYEIKDNILYFYCPEGYGKTKLSNTFIEQKLKVNASTRNLRTVKKIVEMLG